MLWIALVLALCAPLCAQDETPPGPSNPTVEWVNDRIEAIEAREDLDEAARTALADVYRATLELLKNAEADRTAAAEFKRLQDSAPDQLAAINEELASPRPEPELMVPADPEPISPDDATTSQLENMLAQASADLEAATQGQKNIEEELGTRENRTSQIPGEIASVNQQIESVGEEIASRAGAQTDQEIAELARLVAQRAASQSQVSKLTAESSSLVARADLISARLERAKRRVAIADDRLKAWRPIVDARREADAVKAAADAEVAARQAARKHNVLDQFAKVTSALAQRQVDSGSPKRRADAEIERDELRRDLQLVKSEFRSLEEDIEDLGMSRATGLLARRNLMALPTESQLRRQASRIERSLDDVVVDFVDIDTELEAVASIDDSVRRLVEQIEAATPNADLELMAVEARSLVQQRQALLENYRKELEATKDFHKESLKLLRDREEKDETSGLIELVDEYRGYIEARIFWVRSVSGSNLPDVGKAFGSMRWLFDLNAWYEGLGRSTRALLSRPYVLGALVLVVGLFIGARYWARRELKRRAELVSRYRTDSMVHTIVAAGLTLVHAAFWPVMVFLASAFLRIHTDQDPPEPVEAFAVGMVRALHTLIPLELLRQLSRPDGLLDAHFNWPSAGLRFARRWLTILGTPLILFQLIVGAMEAQAYLQWAESIGRIAFIASELVGAAGLILLLSPSNQIVSSLLARDSASLARKTRYLWYPACVAIPISLAILSTLGFHSTATKIDTRIVDTFLFIAIIAAANGMLMRWLFLAQRRIAIDEARRKLQAGADETNPIDEDAIDVPAISQKARLLFRNGLAVTFVIGMSMIWTDVLPALRFLERIELYPNTGINEPEKPVAFAEPAPPAEQADPASAEEGEQAAASPFPTPLPTPTTSTSTDTDQPFRLSAADVGAALVTLIITFLIFQNFPAFVEIALLQRLPLDSGSRYALSTILKYLIATIGSIVMFGALGLSWSQVQWLAAALTFGLAFGLQEIVANFVSGLIMLVERPVRVGDTVTVEGVSGTVTRIRMRATTIVDWDRKELVIPNKTFITTQVINWTLSDTILRIICPVGVAYHSDVDKVRRTLLNVAFSHERVLKDPPPRALFRKFGDNALHFELRFFVPHIDDLLSVTDAMHTKITESFRESEIEIAYPQVDVHMRATSDIGGLIKPMSKEDARHQGDDA